MLTKLTEQNRITLPLSVTEALGPVEYFEITVEGGQIILTPIKIQRSDAVREKLAELNITEQDVADALTWAREGSTADCLTHLRNPLISRRRLCPKAP